jgi:integrase/DNA-directed RNA polymerase subunit RPC12/RpoP
MQGHIRRRGKGGSFEYIIDIGDSQAQRCQTCSRRFWVERQPLAVCPRCGGRLELVVERRRQTKAGFASRKEARSAMNKVLAAVSERSYVAPTRLTVEQFLVGEWLPAIQSTVRLTTFRSYVQHVRWHIAPYLGELPLQSLTGAQINALYAILARRGRRSGEAGLSAQTIRHVHAVLHRALRDAVRWGLISRNPIESADPPRVSSAREMHTWNPEQLEAFLTFTEADRLHALWQLLALTGMRRGEACGLRWSDCDLEQGRIAVCRALVPVARTVLVTEPKTARGRRSIALDERTVAVLRAHAGRQTAERTAATKWSETGLVFTGKDGRALPPNSVSRCFVRAVKKARLPEIRLHDLRHTHATLALRAGIHPKVVSERLGHATVAITLDTYSHAIPALQEEAASRIAGLVFGDEYRRRVDPVCRHECRHQAFGRARSNPGKWPLAGESCGGGDRSRTGD